jgi:UDP-2,3-diacylglucosamine pyrophosphatase LpxH
MNDGDWVESCSALVEHEDGKWEIIYWNKIV